MYIVTKLEITKDGKEHVIKVFKEGNDQYLCQGETDNDPEFPLLCQVESYDPTMLVSEDMPQLLKELHKVRQTITDPEDIAHVDEIINLAEECKNNPISMITFY